MPTWPRLSPEDSFFLQPQTMRYFCFA